MDVARNLDVPRHVAHEARQPPNRIVAMMFILLQTNPLEGWFIGSGKAYVVVGVACVILIGMAWWLLRAENRLSRMEKLLNSKKNAPSD